MLSPEYQVIVAATPHIRPGFHWVALLVLLLILLIVVALSIGFLSS